MAIRRASLAQVVHLEKVAMLDDPEVDQLQEVALAKKMILISQEVNHQAMTQ